ncbi:MAG: hypothetical protein QOG34_574, partial [Frankiaceae bacterium]|nr:hypothetical protein [Frankiaceae bacterium]
MSRRPFAAALTIVAALGATAGCGGGGSDARHEGLAWDGTPKVFRAKHRLTDRVVIARVRNTGRDTLHLVAKDL